LKHKAFLLPVAVGAVAMFAAVGGDASPDSPQLSNVPTANTKAAGYAPSSRLSAELSQIAVAQGRMKLENPQRLLFTTENPSAPTYAVTVNYPSTVDDVSGALGRGGYEGIRDDSDGNLWIVEDQGGAFKGTTVAKIPNSFVFRYVPAHHGDLQHGKLEALQVLNAANNPITVESQTALDAPDQVALHTYGKVFSTKWVTIHNTANDGNAPFNANTLAKAAHATPFKRPENGVFRPRSSASSSSPRPATRATRVSRTPRPAAGEVCSSWSSPIRRQIRGRSRSSSRHPGGDRSRQHQLPVEGPARSGRGRRRWVARIPERTRLGLLVRRERRLLEPAEPAGSVDRRGT
jgi:hypothetical protein